MSVVPVDADTGEVLEGEVFREFTEHEARYFVERINHSVAVAGDLIVEAYERRIWKPLGYATWDDFAAAEIGAPDMAPPARAALAVGLRKAGMSLRAIRAVTGTSLGTAHRDTAGVQELNTSTGVDGKSYPATQPERNATQQEGAGDDGSLCEGDDAESVDGADSHDVGRTEPESAPAPTDPGEADDREAPEGHSSPDTSPGSPIDALDEIDPEGKAEAEDAAYRTALHRSIARVRADLFTFDAERIAEVAGPDTWAAIDEVCAAFDRWRDALDATRPKPFTVIRGGAQ